MTGEIYKEKIDGVSVNVLCKSHLWMLMKHQAKNPWPEKFKRKIAPNAREEINRLMIK